VPILAIIYAIFLSFVSIDSLHDEIKGRKRSWKTWLNTATDLVVLWFFVGYWNPGIVRGMGPAALLVFGSAICWDLRNLSAPPDMSNPEISKEHAEGFNRFLKGLCLLVAFPGYWFGAVAAWRCL